MDNLYDQPENTQTIVTPSQQSQGFFLPDFGNFDAGVFLNTINTFSLAWSIFFSVIFMSEFFYYRMKKSWGEMERESKGVAGVRFSRRIWITYLIAWSFFFLFVINPGNISWFWAILAYLAYFIKICLLDASTIPFYKDFLGGLSPIFSLPLLEIPTKLIELFTAKKVSKK